MSIAENMFSQSEKAMLSGDVEGIVGKIEKNILLKILFRKFHNKVNVNANYQFDKKYVDSLDNEQLINLIKFSTLFEKKFYFMGSVTAVPYMLGLLKERQYGNLEEVIDTVLKLNDGSNSYLPFGSWRYGSSKSYEEYEAVLAAVAEKRANGSEEDKQRHSLKLEQQKIKDAKNIWSAIRRKDKAAIRVMIDRGLNLNAANEEGLTVQQALIEQEISL